MSHTTCVSLVSHVRVRLVDQVKGLAGCRRCLTSSPPSRPVWLANPLADAYSGLPLFGSSSVYPRATVPGCRTRGQGRRFRVKAPRHQPEASSARPRRQGPLPAPGGPVPGPDSSLGNNRGDRGHPSGRPRGPGPVQKEHQGHPPQLGPAVITSHPGIVARAARVCQAPGLPLPGRCRPAGPGRRRCSGPIASALAPRRSSAQARSPGRAAGPVSPPAPPCGRTRTGDSSSNPGDPIHYEFNLVSSISCWDRPARRGDL
jgi:hypothetical protein